jgi:hypothetical protein
MLAYNIRDLKNKNNNLNKHNFFNIYELIGKQIINSTYLENSTIDETINPQHSSTTTSTQTTTVKN